MKNCLWSWSLVGLFLASPLLAADPVVVIRDDGYYLLTPESNTLLKVQHVDQRTGTTPQPPGPGPNPAPVDVTAKVKAIAAATGDPKGAQYLAIIYREVAKIPNGTRSQYLNAVREASDTLLDSIEAKAKWAPARQQIGDIITAEEAKGAVNWPSLLNSIAAGLEQASSQQAAIPPELLALIIQLIMQILTRIFGL